MDPVELACLSTDDVDTIDGMIYIDPKKIERFRDIPDRSGSIIKYLSSPYRRYGRTVKMTMRCWDAYKHMIYLTENHCQSNPYNLVIPVFKTGLPRTARTMEAGFNSLCGKLLIDRDIRLNTTGQKKGLGINDLHGRSTATVISDRTMDEKVDILALVSKMTMNEKKMLLAILKDEVNKGGND